jgi:tetratricopeptide (TPR) repeat protein
MGVFMKRHTVPARKLVLTAAAAFLAALFLAGCGMKVMPESELKNLNAQKILDLGAEKYSQYEYDEAIYYYSSIEKIFPADNDEVNDQRAWAKYEIAYIRYQQKQYDESLQLFAEVLKTKSRSTAPRILASEMITKIKTRK